MRKKIKRNKVHFLQSWHICAIPLQVILVTYFGLELGTLGDGQPLEGDKACCS